jgi:hypothetical protein
MNTFINVNFFSNFIFLVFNFFFAFSMYGWGKLFFLRNITKFISLNIVIGMGFTLFVGGILNYFSLASQNYIKIIFLIGIFFSFFEIYKYCNYSNFILMFKKINKINLIFLIPGILLILTIYSSINPDVYNYHDDFQKYFLHPIKMLESGSIFGSSLSSVGTETFGGQSFFQSFYIGWLGIKAINIFDSVFCLSICFLLILEWSIKKGIVIYGSLIAALLLIINQQYVNVSSIYSGVLFMMASNIFVLKILKGHSSIQNCSNFKNIIGMSLCFASLFILKTTYVLFSFVFFSIFVTFFVIFLKTKKNLVISITLIPLLSILFALPWLIYSLKNYINLNISDEKNLIFDFKNFNFDFINLISTKPLYYGGSTLHYSLLIFFGIIFLILLTFLLFQKKIDFDNYNKSVFIVSISSLISVLVIYFIFIFLSGSGYFPLSSSIRYSIPFIISLVLIGILFLYSIIPIKLKYFRIFISINIIVFLITFFSEYTNNTLQSFKCGNKLSFTSFACSKKYIAYNNDVFSPDKKLLVRKWQEMIPEGEAIMSWINTPFYLDFKRNKIIEIDIVGLDNPWSFFPSAKYMIWEYNNYATRSIKTLTSSARNDAYYDRKNAIAALNFIKKIDTLIKSYKIQIISNDGSTLVFKII